MNKLMLAVLPLLAEVSGKELINALVILIIVALCFSAAWWGLGEINPREPFKKIITVILVLLVVLIVINVLLGLIGYQIIKW